MRNTFYEYNVQFHDSQIAHIHVASNYAKHQIIVQIYDRNTISKKLRPAGYYPIKTWGNMTTILLTNFSNESSWMTNVVFWFISRWKLFKMVNSIFGHYLLK